MSPFKIYYYYVEITIFHQLSILPLTSVYNIDDI